MEYRFKPKGVCSQEMIIELEGDTIKSVKIGNIFGDKYEKKAELAGGIILIVLGIKILIEHLNIITNY